MAGVRIEWEVQGRYADYWERVDTYDTYSEASQALVVYDVNEPQYPHRVRMIEVFGN